MSKKIQSLLIIVCVLFAFGFVGIFFIIKNDDKTPDNTELITGTVSNIVVKQDTINVTVNEYSTEFIIPKDLIDDINIIKEDGKIIIAVDKELFTDENDKVLVANAYSINVDDTDVYSLNDYNNYVKPSNFRSMIFAISSALILVFIIFRIVIKLKLKVNKNKGE